MIVIIYISTHYNYIFTHYNYISLHYIYTLYLHIYTLYLPVPLLGPLEVEDPVVLGQRVCGVGCAHLAAVTAANTSK